MHAWEIAAEAEIVEEGAGRIAAYYAAVTAETVEAALATCGKEDNHGLGFGHQVASRQDPYPDPYLEACRYSVDGGAFGLDEVECAAGP
jgi:hypothetical protein